jgi:putative MFS transporter
LLLFTALMGLGLLAVLAQQGGWGPNSGATVSLTLLIVGSCGVIAVLLPYTGESYRASVRGRATGWVAGVSKFGGLLAQGLAVLGVAPVFAVAAGAVAFITFFALVLIVWFCDDTRERDVDEAELLQGPGLARRPLPAPSRAA